MQPRLRKLIPVLLSATVGLGVSLWIGVLHSRLHADPSYASFCNVNAQLNCDVVLTSRYATLAGFGVSTWAVLFHLAVLATALGAGFAGRARTRETLGTAVAVLGGLGFLFSAYMAAIAFGVLHTICLMCSALYLVSICLLVTSWQLRNALRVGGRRQQAEADRPVMIAGLGALAILALVAGYEVLSPPARASTPEQIRQQHPEFYSWFFSQPVIPSMAGTGASVGAPAAAVTLVEFSDFQCGHCAKLHDALEELLPRERGRVRVVFRHFPLDASCNPKLTHSFHADACLAAIAAECAGEQGRFWEYHGVLFDKQAQLGREYLIRYASDLGLDKERFITCLASDPPRLRVQHDIEDGQRAEIDSTPTIFLNDRRIKGALEPDRLLDAFVLAATK